jgi:hypothetical protein
VPSSREAVDASSPWNVWLRDKVGLEVFNNTKTSLSAQCISQSGIGIYFVADFWGFLLGGGLVCGWGAASG